MTPLRNPGSDLKKKKKTVLKASVIPDRTAYSGELVYSDFALQDHLGQLHQKLFLTLNCGKVNSDPFPLRPQEVSFLLEECGFLWGGTQMVY